MEKHFQTHLFSSLWYTLQVELPSSVRVAAGRGREAVTTALAGALREFFTLHYSLPSGQIKQRIQGQWNFPHLTTNTTECVRAKTSHGEIQKLIICHVENSVQNSGHISHFPSSVAERLLANYVAFPDWPKLPGSSPRRQWLMLIFQETLRRNQLWQRTKRDFLKTSGASSIPHFN